MARDMAQIEVVHQSRCPHKGSRCRCKPSYRVQVWDGSTKRFHRRTFKGYPEAKTWRDDVRIAIRNGTLRPRSKPTVGEAAAALLERMKDGSVLDRSGKVYKPSTCRSYKTAVRKYLDEDPLARMAVSAVRRSHVQDYVDRLRKRGLSPRTIANKLDPLRVIFRRAMKRDEIAVDPTDGLELPAVRGRRERIADRSEAATLIAAAPDGEPCSAAHAWTPSCPRRCAAARYERGVGRRSPTRTRPGPRPSG
jgi:hypothetical protein